MPYKSLPWIDPLYPWALPYNAEVLNKAASSTLFSVFGMTRTGIEPRPPETLPNTPLIRPMARYKNIQNDLNQKKKKKRNI